MRMIEAHNRGGLRRNETRGLSSSSINTSSYSSSALVYAGTGARGRGNNIILLRNVSLSRSAKLLSQMLSKLWRGQSKIHNMLSYAAFLSILRVNEHNNIIMIGFIDRIPME